MPEKPSLLKLLANRRNAQKSTGPKTPEGKRRSARNALRHGFFAKKYLLATREEMRAAGRFDQFARSLYATLDPRDDIKRALVHRIIACDWRMRQCLRFEAASVEPILPVPLAARPPVLLPINPPPFQGEGSGVRTIARARIPSRTRPGGNPFPHRLPLAARPPVLRRPRTPPRP